ncbi:MAG: malonic semialdehyde reductase [Deltaproteobacteria bacterium]|nr:malonic semialdehyde reductase [Deltaproteobacteria bacterium]
MSMTKEAIFTQARSYKIFLEGGVSKETFTELYEIAKWAPTANNSCPLRYVFVSSVEGMRLLHNAAMDGNKNKVESASAAVILAYDINFYEHFPTLAPHVKNPAPQASWQPEEREKEAIKNAGIQAGFFMAAARAMGLDCGPMAGFHADVIERDFFQKDSWKYYFVILLGQGDSTELYPRGKRLSLNDACLFQ